MRILNKVGVLYTRWGPKTPPFQLENSDEFLINEVLQKYKNGNFRHICIEILIMVLYSPIKLNF